MNNELEDILTSPLERGKRLRMIRENLLDISRNKLFEKYEIPVGTLQNYEEGRHGGLTERGAKRLIAVFRQEGLHCTLDWLLFGKGTEPSFTASNFSDSLTSEYLINDEASITKELQLFHTLNKDAIDTIISDDGMEPFLKIGDIVAGRRYFSEDIKKLIGIDCIIQAKNGKVLVRKIFEESSPHHYTLTSYNENAKTVTTKLHNVEIFSAAPILWIRRKVTIPT